jgi:hypothetical protein
MIWSSNVVYLFLLFIYVIVGMFAVTTDHAADSDLTRHPEGWMIWSSNAVYLAWLGGFLVGYITLVSIQVSSLVFWWGT